MTSKDYSPETPDSLEQEQSAEGQEGKPSEPPFTEEERLEEQANYIDETLTDLRPAAQEDKQNLEQTEQTFQQEFPEPPAEFSEEPQTVEEVRELEGKQEEIRQQLDNTGEKRQPQPEPEIPEGQPPEKGKIEEQPVAEKRPRLPHEAPIRVEATREQTAEYLQEKLAQALDKLFTEMENNNGEIPEKPASLVDLNDIFKGSRIISEDTLGRQIERLKQSFLSFKKDKGHLPTRQEFKVLGKDTLKDQIGLISQENPQEVNTSPYWKQQQERGASLRPGRSPEIPVQTQPMPPQSNDKSRMSNREK